MCGLLWHFEARYIYLGVSGMRVGRPLPRICTHLRSICWQKPGFSLRDAVQDLVISPPSVERRRTVPSEAGRHPATAMKKGSCRVALLSEMFSACAHTEGQEVKVGEYNAIEDVLDLINNTIRFQGRGAPAVAGCMGGDSTAARANSDV